MGATLRCWRWDGETVVPHRGGVPLSDRGFRYGQHLFESIAVRGKKALLAREHLSLLGTAASRNGFPFPRLLGSALRSFLAGVRLPDGMLRIYLTAGSGAPGSPVREPSCFLAWEKTVFPSCVELDRGIRLATVRDHVAGRGWDEKSGNYLLHLAALATARAAGGDEALVLGPEGCAVSCAMGNLLVWLPAKKGFRILTSDAGARRGAVLQWAERNAPIVRRRITTADLKKAVALAVTNSRLGVMPVASLDGGLLPDTNPARELARTYHRSHGLPGGA
jgi:branched-subunit amino acid aminotransferase/4-amino-4-deoxychorismate lyase